MALKMSQATLLITIGAGSDLVAVATARVEDESDARLHKALSFTVAIPQTLSDQVKSLTEDYLHAQKEL